MTQLLYQTDSYLKEFDANVTSMLQVERTIVLDRTAFYPGGGGQPCDVGFLTVTGVIYPVEKVKKQGQTYYICLVEMNLCLPLVQLHTGRWTGRGEIS